MTSTPSATAASIRFPFAEPPKPFEMIEASPGIFWLRLPLPFRLDHVNIYLIEDGDGFALIDTGIDNKVTREVWDAWFDGPLKGKLITRVISTHCHPDHIGLAGWLCERFGVPLYSSQTEYLDTLCVRLDPSALDAEPYRSFYHSHGLSETLTQTILKRGLQYLRMVSPLPRTFRRVIAGEKLRIGGRKFEVVTGGGHSSEQVMLYCAAQNVFLCADQAMARITPNISVEAIDPDGDPLGIYLRSLDQLRRTIPEDALALPGHNLPFVGLNIRIGELVAHHEARCRAILAACADAPRSVFELVPVMFSRPIEDPHQMSFAFSEALAHANFLVRRDHLKVVKVGDGLAMQAVG